jgi:hypothetical protein
MSNIRMAITRGIKDKLDKYGLNLPTDRRTRAYAAILLMTGLRHNINPT